MKAKELTPLATKDLQDKLSNLQMELIKHNAQIATGTQLKSPGAVRQTKKNIARIMSILKKRNE